MAALKDFSTYSAVATAALYLFGYLALRFHLTALGINSELGVLDGRYLFAGAKFLVAVGAELPVFATIGLPIAVLAWLFRVRLAPLRKRCAAFFQNPRFLLWTSIVLALLAIRFWMGACIPVHDLSLSGPPEPGWLFDLLRNPNSISRSLYFFGLLIYAAAVCIPVLEAARLPRPGAGLKALFATAVLLATITVLLVPVNFGVVVMPYTMDRVAAVGKTPVATGQRAWLLWQGNEWATYFVQAADRRTLVAVPVKEIERIEVSGSDSLFDVLYTGVGDHR